MSFVPLTGPARLIPGEPPREGEIEFTDGRRTLRLPIRGALPVLAKAHRSDDVHPSVALLAGGSFLSMQLIADGRFGPDDGGEGWRVAALDAADEDRVAAMARARAYDQVDAATAEGILRALLDAIADTMPRSAPRSPRRPPARPLARPVGAGGDPDFARRLQERIARNRSGLQDTGPQLVTLSLRVEADEEELVAGAVRLVLQVHAADNPSHLCDAAVLWTETGPGASHGFGDRARTHASIALRAAADVWRVLDRFADLRVPDQITLDSDELLSLLDEGIAALDGVGVQVLWPKYLDRDVTSKVTLSAGRRDATGAFREEPLQDGLLGTQTLFGFQWQVALDGEPLTETEMDELAHATSAVIRIRDNWMVVDSSVLKRARRRMVRTVPVAQAVAAALTGSVVVDDVEHDAVVGASLLAVRERLLGAVTGQPVALPAGLAATLRDYQHQALTWLAEITGQGLGAVLADDMGLGKTITLISLHLHRLETYGADAGPTLVVCPTSLLGNWEAEIRRFAPGVPVRRHHGSARDLDGLAEPTLDQTGPGFVLTTYGTMRNDADLLAEVAWGLVVADEAQHVKNSRSAAARSLRRIGAQARVALTGTPVENDLTELWSILDWVVPGLLGSRNAFRKAWAAPIEAGLEPSKARQFADLLAPFLLRRRKSDPGIAPELPPKTETDHLVGLTKEQVVLYETYVRDCMRRIEEADEEARRGLVLAMLTGLKQICNHPAQFLKQSNPRLGGRSQKLDLLDELLGTVLAEEGAVLVFTQYVAMARLLERHLAAQGVPHQFLHGGTSVREREAMVRRFQAGPGSEGHVPVFLLSLKAGGTGLNLTAADHVIHFDRWWNPAVEDQATDRAYRIGQTRPVQVHRFVTQGTVEEKVAELLARKRALADAVLSSGEAALTELSDSELRDLVELRP
ncbi:MAG: DEAD/DEAH box helicase [Nocardioides sp.]|uniref:DEAD/DEAH box helicase n=1 Tax=Nocardioides sp. TaxID=35761 RepID=UPI003F060F22